MEKTLARKREEDIKRNEEQIEQNIIDLERKTKLQYKKALEE